MHFRILACAVFTFLQAAPPASAAVVVAIYPRTVALRAGAEQRFGAVVYRTANQAVTWQVNGVPGGNAVLGTISPEGVYTAPSLPPAEPVIVTAASVAAPGATASATLTILNPVPTILSIDPAGVPLGFFEFTVEGSGFVPGSTVQLGSTAMATNWVSPTRMTASGTAPLVPGGMIAVTVANPDPGGAVSRAVAVTVGPPAPRVAAAAAARFLEQIAWGADPASIVRVQEVGFDAYLDEQFEMPPSPYPVYTESEPSLIPVRQRFLINALTGRDQLRQRVAFALGQIFVVSGLKVFKPHMFVPWLELLRDHAFGNYATLLREVTLSPSMGSFLDLVYNEKSNEIMRSTPNENYARELLQLFTIGTDRLNADGTRQLGADGQPVPAYDQAVVEDLARALTGWTFPSRPGAVAQTRNPPYYSGRLEPVAATHDTGEKVLLDGAVLPAGQDPEEDLAAALDLIFHHPNVGPFLARRLIQQLVTSNPDPAYVSRVAAVFAANRDGIRGDLRAVIKAIVLDPEARRGDGPGESRSIDGHLREPVLYMLGLLRALGAEASPSSRIIDLLSPAGQSLFYPPSVFNYYSLTYELPGHDLIAPEFELFTPSAAVYRGNLALLATFAPEVGNLVVDLSPFEPLASEPSLLVESVNRALMHGRMAPAMRESIERAVAAVSSVAPSVRVKTALFLAASSSQYQVQR